MCFLLYQFPWWRVESDGLDIDCNVSFGCDSLETGCWSQRAFRVEHTARLKDFFENFEKPKDPLFPLGCPSLPLFFASLRPIASMRTWRYGTKMGDIDSLTPLPTFFCHSPTANSVSSQFGRVPAAHHGPQWPVTVRVDASHFGPSS